MLQAKAEGFARSGNSSPGGEQPKDAIDGNPKTKYLNFGGTGSGIIIHLPGPPKILRGLGITSANDAPEHDPTAVLIERSLDGKTYERITEQKLAPFRARFENQQFRFENLTAHRDFRITFTQLAATNAMQVADVQLLAGDPPKEEVKSTLTAKPLAVLNPAAATGCLAEQPTGRSPRFGLDARQREAAGAGSHSKAGPTVAGTNRPAAAERIDLEMNALGCYACHNRGTKGGPTAERANYFGYQIVVDFFGQEGRLPPLLSDVGAKLTRRIRRHAAVRAEVSDLHGHADATVRPPECEPVPAAFREADGDKVPAHEPQFSARLAEDGRTLVGKTHLACINCHAWGQYRLPGAEGLDH